MIVDEAKAVAATTPPIVVSASTYMGISFQEWVYILTALYTLVQIARLLPKLYGCTRCFAQEWTCPRTCLTDKKP